MGVFSDQNYVVIVFCDSGMLDFVPNLISMMLNTMYLKSDVKSWQLWCENFQCNLSQLGQRRMSEKLYQWIQGTTVSLQTILLALR